MIFTIVIASYSSVPYRLLVDYGVKYGTYGDTTLTGFIQKLDSIYLNFPFIANISSSGSNGMFHERLKIKGDVVTTCTDYSKIYKEFKSLVGTYFSTPYHLLCGHNAKEFDFPYMARRMIIHNIELPNKLNLFGKKPWEVPHIDTLELWKFGDYKHYTSLKLLTTILGIPSPKDDIDGSEVRTVFYQEKDINRIIIYCEKDTVAVAQIFLRLRNDTLLDPSEIISVYQCKT